MPDFFAQRIKVEKEPVYAVEEKPEKKARTVTHLLHANHSIYSVIYHNFEFHNHLPHILGSAYIFGSTNEHLNEVYDVETQVLEKWTDSPSEITGDNWRNYIGKKEYQRAYMDFFEDEIPKHGNDWKAMTEHYLFEGPEPLINNVICGLAHPLIHLGYAYELSSRTIATEALVLATCFHNSLHKYLDDPTYTRPPPFPPSPSPLALLDRLRHDPRFDALFPHKGDTNIYTLLAERESAVLEYWNALSIPSNPTVIFAACQRAAVELLVATRADDGEKYDFFLVHLLTSSHAVRHLLPQLPARWHVPLARQWWLLVVTIYVAQHRPAVVRERVEGVDLGGRDWGFVVREALEGEMRNDVHYVKALRAIKNVADTWGDDESQFLLKAAVKFATEFNGWGGFAPAEIARTDERNHARVGISTEEADGAREVLLQGDKKADEQGA